MIQDLISEKIKQFNSIDFLINENSIFEIIMDSHLSPIQKQVYIKLFIKNDIATLIYHFNKVMNNNYHEFLQSLTKYLCDKDNYNYDDILRIISDFTQPIYSHLNPDTVIDFDGNIYKTVKIGTQIWMAENLRVTHDINGKKVNHEFFGDDKTKIMYGAYYGQFALESDIAPKGWRIPSLGDFNELKSFLMKKYPEEENIWKTIASNVLWEKSDIKNSIGYDQKRNNITGFNLYPAGYSNSVGNWNNQFRHANLWTSTTRFKTNCDQYYRLSLASDNDYRIIDYDHAYYGFNIRCIKD